MQAVHLRLTVFALVLLCAATTARSAVASTPSSDDPTAGQTTPLRVGTLAGAPGRCAAGASSVAERELIEAFARSQARRLRWVCFDNHDELRRAVSAASVDMAAAHLAQQPAPLDGLPSLRFSAPLALAQPQLLTRLDAGVERLGALHDVTIGVRRASGAADDLSAWQLDDPRNRLRWYDRTARGAVLLEDLRAGRVDVLVLGQDEARQALAMHEDLRLAGSVGAMRARGWAFPLQDRQLHQAAQAFVRSRHVAIAALRMQHGDLGEMRERGLLRVAAIPERHRYFIAGGRLRGFDYELLERFATDHGLELELLVPDSVEEGLRWLRSGHADLATLSGPRSSAAAGLRLTRPYRTARYVIAARSGHGPRPLDALGAAPLLVPAIVPAARPLEALASHVALPRIERAAPAHTALDLLASVAGGEQALALVDADHVEAARQLGIGVEEVAALPGSFEERWAMRAESEALQAALDAFIEGEYRGLFYNVVHRRYFERTRVRARTDNHENLSPYDATLRESARLHGFDWRLLAAQMFEESGFDPGARSERGAEGLMQILPRTGEDLGLRDVMRPSASIEAGVRYLSQLRERYAAEVPADARTWLALASYNAGFRRIEQARRLARALNLSPDRWFGHVELALTRLDGSHDPDTGRRVHCRCEETLNYVRRIRARYAAYRQLLPRHSDHPTVGGSWALEHSVPALPSPG